MRRIVLIAATLVAFVAVGITIWFQGQGETSPIGGGAAEEYDTTGGQEMRPRWDSGGQSDDAAGN